MKKKRPLTLAEANALVAKYRGMPKWKYMLRRGWSALVSSAILTALVVGIGTLPWWLRLLWMLLVMLNTFSFARWESSWEGWQRMTPPTVEQAEALRDQMRHLASQPDTDPFDAQMMYEVAKAMDEWITGDE